MKYFEKKIGEIFEFTPNIKEPFFLSKNTGAAVMLCFGVESHFYPEKYICIPERGYVDNLFVKDENVFEYLGESATEKSYLIRKYGFISNKEE